MTSPSAFEARVDALYALPLDEFVSGRKRLAVELKSEGAAAEARAFLALAKPTLSAWLTNQTVRRAPDLLTELLAATDAVGAAQRKQPRAPGASDFPVAVAAQRRVVSQLLEQARAVVAGGAPADALDRVENNLRWGAIAGVDRQALARGRLVRDVAAPGFGGFGDVAPMVSDVERPAPPQAKSDAPRDAESRAPAEAHGKAKADAHREAESARDRARAAAEAERERKRLVAMHEGALREAQSQTTRARRELARAERDREAADQRVTAAEAALASARALREEADERLREAAEAVASREAAEETLRRGGPATGDP